eukprot:5761085-Amphidinium_carterae.1
MQIKRIESHVVSTLFTTWNILWRMPLQQKAELSCCDVACARMCILGAQYIVTQVMFAALPIYGYLVPTRRATACVGGKL